MLYCDLCYRVKDGEDVSMYGYDKICPGCRERIESGLSVDTALKVYHWPTVYALASAVPGEVIVVADSLEHALNFVATNSTPDIHLLPELEKKMPLIYSIDVENPWAVLIEGSA